MNRKNMVLGFLVSLTLFSCAGTNMIKKDSGVTGSGNSIIYGKFSGLPVYGTETELALYNKELDKIYHLTLKLNSDASSNVIFAYDIPPGKYELFYYREIVNSVFTNYYYWHQEYSEINPVTNSQIDNVFKNIKHTEIDIPANQSVYIGDWLFPAGYNEPIIKNNKNKTDREALVQFPNIISNSIAVIPETHAKDPVIAKINTALSIAVISISNIIIVDDKNTKYVNLSGISLTNKDTSGKIYSGRLKTLNNLCFVNGLSSGKYKISRLDTPIFNDLWHKRLENVAAVFSEDPAPGGTNAMEGVTRFNQNVIDYKNAAADFVIDKPGIYYLGSYDIIIDSRFGYLNNGRNQVVYRPERMTEDIKALKEYLGSENAGWDTENISVLPNAFYSTNFTYGYFLWK